MEDTPVKEEIVMTPSKKGKTTHIRIEKRKKLDLSSHSIAHVAGGQHSGLIVQKQTEEGEADGRPERQIGFNCFLVDQKTQNRVVESRRLKFWYVDGTEYLDQVTTAYEFFKELVRPENFPKDYVGFIKKCMKQMQKPEYRLAKKVDLEIRTLDSEEAPLSPGFAKEDTRPKEEVVREKILTILESAYPNVLQQEDLVRITMADEMMVAQQLQELQLKGLVREMEKGGWVRHVLEDAKTAGTCQEVQMVKHIPQTGTGNPTIAVITANYCEKLAVDSMMENKTTFVKFKSEGESNVYTIGNIGEHKVVSTKLPMIGHARAAQISSGNTTTRLLGSFQEIEHVFVVGIAGGVPHYTNFYKHARLGDIIVSKCDDRGYMYYHCEQVVQDRDRGDISYKTKTWAPRDLELQRVLENLQDQARRKPEKVPWEKYINEGLSLLIDQEADFNRPPPESDRLYMNIGDDQVIDVQHPLLPEDDNTFREGVPTVHYGVMGSGRFNKSEVWRMDFAQRHNIRCFDTEFDQVLESIVGNRKDSFLFIRGIADYSHGTKNREWHPYASLVAAAMMKTIIKCISNSSLSEDDD